MVYFEHVIAGRPIKRRGGNKNTLYGLSFKWTNVLNQLH